MQRPIEVATWIGAGIAKVCEILADDPGVVFGDTATTHEHQSRRTVLGVDLRSGASVHQEVLVHLGVVRTTGAGLVLPMAWEARGRRRLFPTFAGALEASDADDGTRLGLHGTYTVPLGTVGRVANGVVGWRLARRSLDALLVELGRQLDVEVDRRGGSASDRRTPEWEHSEIYIG